jgi:hypothetical protein
VPSMSEMLAEHTALADEEHQQLRLLVSKWQLLADLAFSDLVLWMPRPLPQRLLGSGADPADHRSDGAGGRRAGRSHRVAPEHLVSTGAYLPQRGGRAEQWGKAAGRAG